MSNGSVEQEPPPGQQGVWATLRGLVPNLLTTVLATVGVVGFVAVVGGAITWNRFNAVELPADQAVAALPESQLVAIGIAALVFFLLLAAGAVVVVGQLEHRGPGRRRWALLTIVAFGMTYAILIVPGDTPESRIGIPVLHKVVLVALIVLAWALAFVLLGWRSNDDGSAPALKRWICGDQPGPGEEWRRQWLRRLCQLNPGRPTGGWARTLLSTDPAQATARLMMMLFGAELLFALVLWRAYDPWLGATLLIGGVLGAICLLIADRDRSGFGDYGLAIFMSVVIFGGATEAMQARYRPRVQPAALIRVGEEQGKGLCGLYVTENDDRVYLGRLRPDPRDAALPARDSGRIFFVDRDKVAAVSIGPRMSIQDATKRASQLRAELVVDAAPPAPERATVVTTRRFKRRGVEVEEQRTQTVPLRSRKGAGAAPSGSRTNPPADVTGADDRELAARRAEAELSCAPPPVAAPAK